MCKRLVIPEQDDVEKEISVEQPWWKFSVRFNVAVSQRVPVARVHNLEVEGVMMQWGFVPSPEDERPEPIGEACLRADSILSAHDYRKAWLYGQRAVIPVAGFYVWRLKNGVSQPFYVRLVNRGVFGVAALWERTVIDREDVVESCALLTVPANELMADSNDKSEQMPAILHRRDYHEWLTSTTSKAQTLLKPYPFERMVTHAVSPRVNYLEFDDPGLIRPAK